MYHIALIDLPDSYDATGNLKQEEWRSLVSGNQGSTNLAILIKLSK